MVLGISLPTNYYYFLSGRYVLATDAIFYAGFFSFTPILFSIIFNRAKKMADVYNDRNDCSNLDFNADF